MINSLERACNEKKLTSRKFWLAVIGFVTAISTAFNVPGMTIEQVIAVVSAASVLIQHPIKQLIQTDLYQ